MTAARAALIALGLLLPRAALAADAAPPADPAGTAFFESKVRPLLVQHCYECHSADANKAKGGLHADTREGLLQGGDNGPSVVPGKPDESRLILAVRFADPDLQMPPKKRLPAEAVAVLEKWVAMGAPDPRDGSAPAPAKKGIDIAAGKQFWSFRPLAKVSPPEVVDAAWTRSPVDRFVRAKQADKGIVPNGPASREKLIRRAYFDLIGLPPSPAEVDAFVADQSPDAYAKLVDRLLDSDRHGERWGRHWLDVARFAESGGYEFDKDRAGAYHYRDFVIRALNADMPYDQFVRWQLAGDKLAPGDYAAGAATGFVVAGPYPGQTTAKTLEPIRYDHLDDMASTVGTAMLGLTVGCARCHDHKYDPLPDADYYRLVACFAKTDSTDLQLNPDVESFNKAKGEFDANHKPLVEAWERFRKEELPGRFDAWRAARPATQGTTPPPWLILDWVSAAGTPALKNMGDGSYLATGSIQKNDVYTFVARTNLKGIAALRLDALSDPTLPLTGPGRADPGNFKLTRIELKATPLGGKEKAKPIDVALKAIAATSEAPNQPLAQAVMSDAERKEKKISGGGWSPKVAPGMQQSALFETVGEVGFEGGTELTLTLKFEDSYAIGRPRVAISLDAKAPIDGEVTLQNTREIDALLATSGGAVVDANRDELMRWFRAVDPQAAKLYGAVVDHAFAEPKPGMTRVFAAGNAGGDVFFLNRGDPGKKLGKATPGFLQVLMSGDADDARWTTKQLASAAPKASADAQPVEPRVALADWITDVDHGAGRLLARVIVNRLWQHHMGRGIVGTPNDFGTQGDAPTHPELLDYLANELIRGGWRLKPIHRLLMASSVYMQDGAANAANEKVDPDNKLLWRRSARRLEAEAVRDALLSVGGTLDLTPFGPGTADENVPRRSVYLTVKRSKPVPFMQIFDAPEAMQSIGQRQNTTVATQALAMLNSPFVRDRAEKLAGRARPNGDDRSDAAVGLAIDAAYRIALGRHPSDAERSSMVGFVRSQGETYEKGVKGFDRSLADACQILLCSSEFVYVE